MSSGITNSPESRYWRHLYSAALFEIEECRLPARIAEAERGGCATRAGTISGRRP